MMTEQPNFLTSRLRRLQADTRKEYEESGREQLNAAKIVAAAKVYAEDQAANHSSGYQSNDSAPEELNEESTHDSQSDFMCAQVGVNLRDMTLEDLNRPWHEEVDEYLDAEHSSRPVRAPTLCNGHDSNAPSPHWTQQNARNILLENRIDVAQASGAGQASWPRRQSQAFDNQTHANEWSSNASNTYQLFDKPASHSTTVLQDVDPSMTQNDDHRPRQPSVPPTTPQYTFQDRRQYDEQPVETREWVAPSADDRDKEQQWAQPEQRNDFCSYEQQQWTHSAQPADLQPHEQHHYSKTCRQADRKQHSDGLGRSSQVYREPAPEAPFFLQPEDVPQWMTVDLGTNLDNQAQQFISPALVSVAAALSTMTSAPRNNVANEYMTQTSPVRSASYADNALRYSTSPAGYQLKMVETCAASDRNQTYGVANCANAEIGSTFENQVLCVESQGADSKCYYVLVDQPPSLSEVDVTKPPPPLPNILSKSSTVSSVSNSANATEVSYIHQTDASSPIQASPFTLVRSQELYQEPSHLQTSQPRATVNMQRYAPQKIAQSSHFLSDALYPQLAEPDVDTSQSNMNRCIAQSSSYSSNTLYPHLTSETMSANAFQSDVHQRTAQPSSHMFIPFQAESTHDMLQADALLSDRHQGVAQSPSYPQGSPYAPKSLQMYAEAPQSDASYWEAPLPPSPPQGATPDVLYSEMASHQQMTSGSGYVQSTPFCLETSVDEFAIQRRASPIFDDNQALYDSRFGAGDENQSLYSSPFETTTDDLGRRMPTAKSVSPSSPLRIAAQVKCSQSASTAQTRRSFRTASPTEVRVASVATLTPGAPESAQTTPTNPAPGMRRNGQRWANSRNGDQSAQNSTNSPNGSRRDGKCGSNSRNSSQSAQTTPTNQAGGKRWDVHRGSKSRNSNDSGYSTPQDQRQQQRHSGSGGRFSGGSGGPASGNRSMKRPSYTPEEEHRLSVSLMDSYGAPLEAVLERCFSKCVLFGVPCTLRSNRNVHHAEDMFVSPLWPQVASTELAQVKDRLNSVKERLSSYDLNEWHRHTRATNPADMVMRRLRSDIKVEFLTQAWCKFYELVDNFKLVPRDARKSGELRTIHLCEAPGAFVASLNHYLRLNHPDLKWRWRANSLNPFYEGNHLSAMINDDRFMLQTIENWDFGPDMTGDIMHPGYPDHLRRVWGDGQLTHLVTADGSFDCQDKPEEQEKLVSWLHLKEALTAIRVLRKGGHFVIKMFTFFECESVCLLYLLQCVFESIDVMKPATSKEGNSEVYVVCRSFKDEPSFEPFIRRLLDIDEKTFSSFAMFPFERIPRPFLRSLENCATKFANFQIDVIERNIRLYQHERYGEFRRHFEFVQEKLFEEYVKRYRVEPIPLEKTVVRMPHRRSDNRFFASPKVLEQREHKQGSHDDQLKRSSLGKKDLVKVVADELATFPHHQLLSQKTVVPKVELLAQDFEIRCGKPIHTITSSQFCHGMLIRVRNELMNTLDHRQYYIAAAEMERSVDMENNPEQYPNLCDFAKQAMLMKTYNDTQREIYGMLFNRLATLEENEHLTLFCFPLLTQFNISVLCILNQIFEEIVLEPPHTLFLRKRDTKNFGFWMPKLQEIFRVYTPDQAVISFLPIRKITGASNPFYSWVIEANNSQIIREINLFSSYHS